MARGDKARSPAAARVRFILARLLLALGLIITPIWIGCLAVAAFQFLAHLFH